MMINITLPDGSMKQMHQESNAIEQSYLTQILQCGAITLLFY